MLRLLEPCISPAHIVTSNYLNVRELCDYGYEKIPRVKELLASYLSHCMASSLKVPLLLSKPCQTTLCLMGKAFKSPSPQPRWRTVSRDSPLALLNHRCCSTKQTACATFSSMAAMVVSEQHLWLNISGISPFGLSGSAVNMVVQNSERQKFSWWYSRVSFPTAVMFLWTPTTLLTVSQDVVPGESVRRRMWPPTVLLLRVEEKMACPQKIQEGSQGSYLH